jgi:hypothetical protein
MLQLILKIDCFMELSNLEKGDLRLSLYWHMAGGKLRYALNNLSPDGVSKKYPVADDSQGYQIDKLIIGSTRLEDISPEEGNLSLSVNSCGIHILRLVFAQPVDQIELRDLTISGRLKPYKLNEPISSLAFGYTNWRTGLFGVNADHSISEVFDRTLTGSFASLALSRALGLR